MKVSLNTIKQYTDVDLSVNELVTRINRQLGKVEEVIDLGERYKDALIVKVVSAEQHPNADRLKVTRIDDGGVRQGVERDEDGYVQVVCGAPNAREGILAVWLPPNSTVPASYSEKELFVLGSRELRGAMSHGMLAASDELDIGSDHAGILEIDPGEWKPNDIQINPGASFAEAYGLNDTIIDIENKMFTHRPDLFGQLGVAREIAGIQHKQFISPEWYKNLPEFGSGDGLDLGVVNDAPQKAPRFMAVAIKDVEVKPSPLWLQCELVRLGSKPINNIVDVTNYIMLLTAQPVHAYDYDKLRGGKLGVRLASKGETLTLLNHKTYQLDEDDIVIVDGEGPVGLAGIMGGGDSEVSNDTKNIVLEVATFDMYAVRKTSMRHGLFTDALTRFNKGQSPLQNPNVMSLLMQSIYDAASGSQATRVYDVSPEVTAVPPVEVTSDFINSRLGLSLSENEITDLLANVEFEVSEGLRIAAPFWRTDIELPEDVVEEVGRLYGFDKLPRELPKRSIRPAGKNQLFETKQAVRRSLSRAGASEVLTYSFVHENTLKKAEQDPTEAFRLSNALSPDLQYYRLSVLPSLLDKVHMNVKAGHDEFTLFEIGKGHNKKYHLDDDDGLPSELQFVDAVYTSKKPQEGAVYFRIRRLLDHLVSEFGSELVYKPIEEKMDYPVTAPFDLTRSALVETTDGVFIGMVGELKQTVLQKFKLPEYTSAMTLDLEGLSKILEASTGGYRPLPKYPGTEKDLTLRVKSDVKFAEIDRVIRESLNVVDLNLDVEPVTIYQADDDDRKNVTFRFKIVDDENTITAEAANAAVDKVADEARSKLSAERL